MNKFFILISMFFCMVTRSNVADRGLDRDLEKIYGHEGLNLAYEKKEFIKKLFITLFAMPLEEQKKVAQEVAQNILQQIKVIEQKIKDSNAKNEQASDILFFKIFILKSYYEHLLHYRYYAPGHETYVEQFIGNFSRLFKNIFSVVDNNKNQSSLSQPALDILSYIAFEQDEIFFNYKKLLLFLAVKQKNKIPPLLNIWDNEQLVEKIKKRSKRMATVEVQAFEFIISLGLQALVMAGGSIAMQWEDDANRIAYEEANKAQNDITSSWQVFQNELAQEQQNVINAIEMAFTNSQKILSDYYEKNDAFLRQEIMYLNRSINLSKPLQRALVAPIIYDQYFSHAIMITPGNANWYNIYQVVGSDWGFDPSFNCFFQYGLAPFAKVPLWDKKNDPTASLFTDDPVANSIFTECAFDGTSHTIEIECTLMNLSYPFFVGIMINRGHWISGDPERIWQYRLLGLYGAQEQANNSIDLCFAQQKLIPAVEGKSTEQIISPLEQIMKNKETHLYSLEKNDVSSLEKNEITYVIKLVTNPTSVSCSLGKKDKEEDSTITPLFTKTIDNLPSYIFMSGGIGFIASGCQARFRVKQPSQLVYSEAQLKLFKKQLITNS